jgi:hypothetical protein
MNVELSGLLEAGDAALKPWCCTAEALDREEVEMK